ncbi:hypothetical protein ACLB2K_061108 [Fragaria x ananassa]
MSIPEELGCCRSKWFFTREEIECHAPSRRDGIGLKKEAQLRRSYSWLLQEIGTKLKVPHLTIATAHILCHCFYMRQSHAKNDWQTIASACILVACKMDNTPHFLDDVALLAYEIAHKSNPSAIQSIKQRLPYKTLVAVLKRLNLPDLAQFTKVAWHLVDQWLQTSLCLQYMPQYIAAGSIDLAARILEVKLPTEKGRVWWSEIDVAPEQLDEVTKLMRSKLEPLPSKGVLD